MAELYYLRAAPPYPFGSVPRDFPRSFLLYAGVDPLNLGAHEGKGYYIAMTPFDAALFALVVVVAGGIREELQRAFLLHRFEQHLGGARVGLVVTSLSFGVGHLLQGADAVIATAALGAFWGVVYLRRRSALAPIVSHAGFNLLQLAQFLLVPR